MSAFQLVLYTVTFAKVPVLGSVRSVTESHVLVTLEDGVATHQTCSVEVRAQLARTRMPDAFISALPVLTYPLDLSDAFEADLGPVAVGYDPAGPFPEHADEASDTDGDGQAGVTVVLEIPLLGEVEMRVAQLSHIVLRGERVGPQRWEGTAELVEFKQILLATDNPLLTSHPPVEPGVGRFTLEALEGATTCRDLSR